MCQVLSYPIRIQPQNKQKKSYPLGSISLMGEVVKQVYKYIIVQFLSIMKAMNKTEFRLKRQWRVCSLFYKVKSKKATPRRNFNRDLNAGKEEAMRRYEEEYYKQSSGHLQRPWGTKQLSNLRKREKTSVAGAEPHREMGKERIRTKACFVFFSAFLSFLLIFTITHFTYGEKNLRFGKVLWTSQGHTANTGRTAICLQVSLIVANWKGHKKGR